MEPMFSNLLNVNFVVPPRNMNIGSIYMESFDKSISATVASLHSIGFIIRLDNFIPKCSIDEIKRCIVGTSLCNRRFKLLKMDTAAELNNKAGSTNAVLTLDQYIALV